MEPDKIERNEALRSLAKLGLNSFWVCFKCINGKTWILYYNIYISGQVWTTVKLDQDGLLYDGTGNWAYFE